MVGLIERATGLWVHIHPPIDHAGLVPWDVIRPYIECASAGGVKSRLMPVTGEDTVFECATMEGEAHVGTAVVYGTEGLALQKQCDGMRS